MTIRSMNEEQVRENWLEWTGLTEEQDDWVWASAKDLVDDFIYAESSPSPFAAMAVFMAAAAYCAAHADMEPKRYEEFIGSNYASLFALANWELDRDMREAQLEEEAKNNPLNYD